MIVRRALCVVLTAMAAASSAAADDLLDRFQDYDHNGDGIIEIDGLERLAAAGGGGPRVLVLIEPRVLAPLDGQPSLAPLIERFIDDLAGEGYRAEALAIRLGQTGLHQDGRFILALRELLRAADAEGELAGAILVGRFPDALIVRTCNWRKKGSITLHKGTEQERKHENARYLRRVPENVASRADIILSDLDGAWEELYIQPRLELETTIAVFEGAVPPHGGACIDLEHGRVTFEDFFHVSDGKLEVSHLPGAETAAAGQWVSLFDDSGDHECSDADRARPNVMAHPDILISRIDAKGTGMSPKSSIIGAGGERLLDEAGRPQAVRFASAKDVPHWRNDIWETDPILERRLLIEYFQRNHAYRTGAVQVAWRPASLACGLSSGYGRMSRAADDWQDEDVQRGDVKGQPTLHQVADWFAYPALLRCVHAHSDPWGSFFRKDDPAALDARLGGPAWSWTRRGDALVPSLQAACAGGKLDWFLLRSLWEYKLAATEPAFYVFNGCHSISPNNAEKFPHNHARYGNRQGGEAMLFLGSGLALVGRAKVFYDEPRQFAETLGRGATFGDAWAHYFDLESQAESWGEVGGDIGRKRAYFWSVLGDWTLRLQR